jgi:hypothetical protein
MQASNHQLDSVDLPLPHLSLPFPFNFSRSTVLCHRTSAMEVNASTASSMLAVWPSNPFDVHNAARRESSIRRRFNREIRRKRDRRFASMHPKAVR